MRFGVLGVIGSDWTNVTYDQVAFARELGFQCRLVHSISEIQKAAAQEGVGLVLEKHVTSTLDSAEPVKRVIGSTYPARVRVNIDPVYFVCDLPTAFDPTPMVEELFDVLGEHCATVHVKDYALEDRLVMHISEMIPGTGMMDLDTVRRRAAALGPDANAIVEPLPIGQIGLAKRNLAERASALGIMVR